MGIVFSLFVTGVAALNLVLDFDFFEQGVVERGAPKYMEWYGAFAPLVTLVWLFLEILRPLSKLQEREEAPPSPRSQTAENAQSGAASF